MKIREFIKLNCEIDVYDDVCEELAICFCGPQGLTKEGEEHFAEVLDYEIEFDFSGDLYTAAVKVDGDDGNKWKKRLRKAKEFFYSAAGYCADEDYQKWFCDSEWYTTHPDVDYILLCVYCDTTGLFSDEEIDKGGNLCDRLFPRKLVRDFYAATGDGKYSFVEWVQDICTADDTDGLYDFCVERGFRAMREPGCQ